MQDLIKQEQFEIEVLQRLNSKRLLNNLVFIGGTMLRLCYGLNRFSIDLDFWLAKTTNPKRLYQNILDILKNQYTVKDSAIKMRTLLFEVKSPQYPRSLKIEIRTDKIQKKLETSIAYSRYVPNQIFLKTLPLEAMMEAKIAAFLDRKEIRDAFDMEFLLQRGVLLKVDNKQLEEMSKTLDQFSTRDYTVKLGSLLEPSQRVYYNKSNFKILRMAMRALNI